MIAPVLRYYSLYLAFFKFANEQMFSVIAMLEYFLLLEALKDSKIPYLFLTDLVSIEFHRSQKNVFLLYFVINKTNQLHYHWKIVFFHLSEI